MDEQHPAARVVDPRTLIGTAPPAREPFDPAGLLDGRKPPMAYVVGPTVEVVREFDPASFLGERALRGAFNLATVKPLLTTLGGVEMVTVPASAYAHALRQVTGQELPAETVQQAGPVPNAGGMLDLLLSLHAAEVVSIGQLAKATGLDHLAIGDLVADHAGQQLGMVGVGREREPVRFARSPEEAHVDLADGTATGEATEAHGAALDTGQTMEAHEAAQDDRKPQRRPREAEPNREVPSDPVKSRHRAMLTAKDR